jgi:hypothetical protein
MMMIIQFLSLSPCKQRVAYNRPAMNVYETKVRLKTRGIRYKN